MNHCTTECFTSTCDEISADCWLLPIMTRLYSLHMQALKPLGSSSTVQAIGHPHSSLPRHPVGWYS